MAPPTPDAIISRFRRAKDRRQPYESYWQECYDFALPQRDTAARVSTTLERRSDRLFDGTAPDAVDQLAASLMSQLTPPGSRWFGFAAGPDAPPEDRTPLGAMLERASAVMHAHFERSNFAVEMHQCYLDLVTAGTATLMLEEAPIGDYSAFRFTAVPLIQSVLEEGPSGRLDVTFRAREMSAAQIIERYPAAHSSERLRRAVVDDASARMTVLEAVLPNHQGYAYAALLLGDGSAGSGAGILSEGSFESTPFINFRWMKAPGEIYGRSPVMKALPDIKTANKVVELVLKNASIAVSGIWQADDDGVINPATIKLAPGTIIPKAVGSAGLTPLEAPGRFDVSELVLDQLRTRIRSALFVDQLGPVRDTRMTATEVLERSAEIARVLGATFGRLQAELLTPLIHRAGSILVRRGEIPDLPIDGRYIALDYRSPQARYQAQLDVQNTLMWLETTRNLGPEGLAVVDLPATARWLGRALGVSADLMREPLPGADSAAAGAMVNHVIDAVTQAAAPPAADGDGATADGRGADHGQR